MSEQNSLALPGAMLLTGAAIGSLMLVAVPHGFAEAVASGDPEGANGWAGIALWFNDGGTVPLAVAALATLLLLALCWAVWRGVEALCARSSRASF